MTQGSRARSAAVAAGLAAAIFAVYGQTAGFDFAPTDDGLYVTGNDVVRSGLSLRGVAWAFTSREAANWHPLTWLSLMLDAELFGVSSAGFHATNAVLHALAAGLLFGALRAATGRLGASALVAALFALHPIHVESVAWISGRKDVLSGLFGFATLWAYVGYARRGGARRYLAVAAWLSAGLMAKPALVTWPCVLLLLDVWPLGRWRPWGRESFLPGVAADLPPVPQRTPAFLVLEKLPLFALTAAASALTWVAQQAPLRVAEPIGVGDRLANAAVAYARYLGKLVWPDGFTIFYPHPALPGGTPLTHGAVALALALLVALSAFAWRRASREPWLLIGWLWFVGVLVPMIGLLQVGRQALADRYAYLAFPGLYLALAWSADSGLAAWRARSALRRDLATALCVALLALLGARAWLQVRVWRDGETLLTHALSHAPRAPFALSGLAAHLVPQRRLAEAEVLLRQALEVDPDDLGALKNLSVVRLARGDLEQAIRLATRVTEIDPSASQQLQLGKFLEAAGRSEEAEARYREAIARDPGEPEARVLLARRLEARGRFEEADAQRVAALEHHQRVLARGFAAARARLRIQEIERERERAVSRRRAQPPE
jgi:tetratricopeptide (TPR) repeat protein